jgi:hypothetical protein
MKTVTGFSSFLFASVATVLIAATLFIPASFAQTGVSGFISTGTVWTVAGSPYIVSGKLLVGRENGLAVLTVEPGVVVKFRAGAALRIGYFGIQTLYTTGLRRLSVFPFRFDDHGEQWKSPVQFRCRKASSYLTLTKSMFLSYKCRR